ncbi:uncharacterized protein LOC143223288 [Tachypleus tridentatus]|uniref:uncharacterized protein LOC143223288 n=1 Tax=Tachypleus tridentatus TaxID=6853 RepID=UPI003FD503AF
MGRWGTITSALLLLFTIVCADMMRKSIVFDSKTPKVFYCPQEKPTGMEKMFVKARPLDKLCEFGGKGVPKNYHSDCYNDVDETEYACAEKRRIMLRLNPPNVTETATTKASVNARPGGKNKKY